MDYMGCRLYCDYNLYYRMDNKYVCVLGVIMNLLMSKMIFLRIPVIQIILIIIRLLFFVFQIIILVNLVKSQKKDYNARKKTKKLIKISIYLLILHEIYFVVSGLINYGLRIYPKESLYILNLLISLLIISMEKKGKRRYRSR